MLWPRALVAALFAPLAFVLFAPAFADAPSQPRPAMASPTPSASPTPGAPLQWRMIGPAVSGGRVATVAGTDRDPNLFYVGAAGGGVWRSTDGGESWMPVFDRAGSQSIGAIAIAPHDTSSVWVGTGDAWPRNDVIPGDGIWHSSDGGTTWEQRGLEGTSQIARIVIDPRDPQHLVVAALGDPFRANDERGIFVSTDDGLTWRKTLARGPELGASDVAMDPKDPQVLYAALWRFRRSAWGLRSGGDNDGIYKSNDGGMTWSPVRGHGLPAGPLGRIALAFAPSDPQRVYAEIEAKDGILWRSDDGGTNWSLVSSNTLINERPFYYSRIVVDPHDPDHLFSVSVLLAESKNGGRTWHVAGKNLHGDHHDLWISAEGGTILEGNDGGVALSRDDGKTWAWRNTLSIAQFYHVAVSDGSHYRICGGLQDNGAWCAPARTGDPRGILASDWTKVANGDGTWVVPDPSGRDLVYAAAGGGDNAGQLTRWQPGAPLADISPYLRDQNVVPPSQLRYRFNWETPIAFDPFDRTTVYTAGDVVFRTRDRGMHWTPISGDVTRNIKERQGLSGGPLRLDVTGAETFDTILALAPSPAAHGELWIGTDDGVVQLTRDGGAHWTNVTIPGLDADARVTSLEPSHFDAATAYASVDRHFAGDRAPYVYATTDYGRTWRPIVHGLPHAEVYAVREDPGARDLLYAGTGIGVWWSADRGTTWERIPAALPQVSVRDLRVQAATRDLVVATHGRGIAVLDDLEPLRARRAAQRAGVMLFLPRTAVPAQRSTPTVNAVAAPDELDAPITFWQNAPAASEPAIEIVDARGRVVRRFAGTHDEGGVAMPNVTNLAGDNRIVWDLGADPPTPWRRQAAWDRGPESGAPVPSGTYTVRLLRDGKTYTQPLTVARYPWVASVADERAGYAFAQQMNDELSALDEALNVLDNVRLQIPARLPAIRDTTLAARARAVASAAEGVARTISSHPVNDQDDDFLTDLLRERVLTFISDLTAGAPTAAQRAEGAALRAQGAQVLAGYRRFVSQQVEPLNAALRAAGLVALDLRAVPPIVKPDPEADEHARRGDE